MNLTETKSAFIKAGYKLDHTSKSDGKVSSYYFERSGKKIRVSNHELGHTVYGERQGLWLDMDFNITDFDASLTPAELVDVVESGDDEKADLIMKGYSPRDAEWSETQ